MRLISQELRARLGQRSWRLNAKRRNNRAKRFASDARSPIAPNAKRGGLNCTVENQRSDVLSALAYKRSASGARCPKQGLNTTNRRPRPPVRACAARCPLNHLFTDKYCDKQGARTDEVAFIDQEPV